MNSRILVILLLMPFGAFAADEQGKLPADNSPGAPQQAAAPPQAPDPYTDLNKQVQETLKARGFYSGPVNGEFGWNTQAALAQFQLSVPMPASGSLDQQTLDALGLAPRVQAIAQNTAVEAPRELGGSCDALIGPDKDRCVQQGGTVEASAKAEASSGASRPAEVKGN